MIQLQCICAGLFLVVVLFSQDCDGAAPPCYVRHDLTTRDCKNGIDVIDAVFAKLECLQILNGCYHILMLRIAYAETEFGESENYACDQNGGGIWRLKRESFDVLLEPNIQTILRNLSDIIQNRIGIRFFEEIRYDFLIKPFYSGLATLLYLHYLELTGGRVPFNGSIEEQAKFWVNNYTLTENATEDYFIKKSGNY